MRMKELDIYKRSKKIVIWMYQLKFPQEETYMLRNQMIRAGHSILLNLCEGSAYKDKNKNKHYKIALGSAYEVESCLDIYEDVIGKVPKEITKELDEICRIIYALSEKNYFLDVHVPAQATKKGE